MASLALRARTPAEAQETSTRPYDARDEGTEANRVRRAGPTLSGAEVVRSEGLSDPCGWIASVGAERLPVGRVLD
jgi:hypothetical protein